MHSLHIKDRQSIWEYQQLSGVVNSRNIWFDQPLKVLISMFIFILLWFVRVNSILILKGNNVFTNSLLDTIIQDGGMKERSNTVTWYYSSNIENRKTKLIKEKKN